MYVVIWDNFACFSNKIKVDIRTEMSTGDFNGYQYFCFHEELTKMKKGNKQCTFDTPRTLMVNKEIISEYHKNNCYALS